MAYEIITLSNIAKDITGLETGRLTVIAPVHQNKHKRFMWLCICDCGSDIVADTCNLSNGHTRSCGCLSREATSISRTTHGLSRSPEYMAYHNAKLRCNDETNNRYEWYGKRGIEFMFSSFEEFIGDIGLRPTPKHSLDRMDNNGNYELGNVRWATIPEQVSNKSNTHNLTLNGITKHVAEWSRVTGIKPETIRYRIKAGWSIEDALTKPVKCHTM